jgi:hypothetical protein
MTGASSRSFGGWVGRWMSSTWEPAFRSRASCSARPRWRYCPRCRTAVRLCSMGLRSGRWPRPAHSDSAHRSSPVTAINRKIEQYYISEEYKFRVAREIRESERKKIEAEGISEFQQIVSHGISDSYLRWRGIEATLQLAQSSNSKIVIVGTGKDGLPVILGTSPQPASPAGTTAAETSTTPLEQTPAKSNRLNGYYLPSRLKEQSNN